MQHRFFALISRMRYIGRWGLMRNTFEENIQEHSHMVAVLAHGLAMIQRDILGEPADPDRCAATALFHDASEILTGDLPTPIKYYNPEIRNAYKQVEAISCRKLLALLPEELRPSYEPLLMESDPDAALHYLARLLEAGDLPSACRRLMVCACEDVGLAYPQIIPIVKAAVDAANMVGLPEARLPLADAVILVATSPKSNSAHNAIIAAMEDIQRGAVGDIPRHLKNVHADSTGADKAPAYKYPHNYPDHYVQQRYLPESLGDTHYYAYGENKTEQAAKRYWDDIKRKNGNGPAVT